MTLKPPEIKYRKDYCPPPYLIDEVDLFFALGDQHTLVTSRLHCRRNVADGRQDSPLVLDGEELELISVFLDNKQLGPDDYLLEKESLTILQPPAAFILEITTLIRPPENTSLEGLYQSSGNFCTQCEAQGFRKITYFLDRPDVMSRYTTTIEADHAVPVLLANGNLVEKGEAGPGRHYAKWHDPFPKPCYLFALVGGNLVRKEDIFTTGSGRDVALHIYVQSHNSDKCDHAMQSLKKAMRWDEQVFGLEYDLDLYMIVAVDDFNMGAMENKGLNVFNSKYVLARPDTATDEDYAGIEGVIAHEYFHNWTGNRITCRDWFQLSLKEGLTVFRDQLFSADMTSGAVKRLHDVTMLRNFQFIEDGGPMAHPVRPDSYIEINNFYTVTVYEKGAELIRMMHTLLGAEGFRRGMDLYFARHDGQAVTCDDFVRAMEDGGPIDLGLFRNWYGQAGTPEVWAASSYDPQGKKYSIQMRQSCPPTPGQHDKPPFHIPVAVGLLDGKGNDIPLFCGERRGTSLVLDLTEKEQTFVFENVPEKPVPSLLRGFSAPVKLHYDYSEEELGFLLAHDADSFCRWEAGQRLACHVLLGLIDDIGKGKKLRLAGNFITVFSDLLAQAGKVDPAFLAQLLVLPSEKYLGEQLAVIDVDAIHQARLFTRRTLARHLKELFSDVYRNFSSTSPYRYDQQSAGRRSLKNVALAYLMQLDDPEVMNQCLRQFEQADNMTDVLAALQSIVHNPDCPERKSVLVSFYGQWQKDTLVLDKWFSLQATAPLPETLSEVMWLMRHPAFSMKNPNKVRSLIGAFCSANQLCFHDKSGAGYIFLTDRVLELNSVNPQIAARLLNPLSRWRRFDEARQGLMRAELERILAAGNLSKDVYEVAAKSLHAA
ncbi:MAG: aminopeptidase N [Desulfobulbaceae bacterium DB1]|nr:MAG: aminopeptidase N [Desulfobulbaceae bacterium DB1]